MYLCVWLCDAVDFTGSLGEGESEGQLLEGLLSEEHAASQNTYLV